MPRTSRAAAVVYDPNGVKGNYKPAHRLILSRLQPARLNSPTGGRFSDQACHQQLQQAPSSISLCQCHVLVPLGVNGGTHTSSKSVLKENCFTASQWLQFILHKKTVARLANISVYMEAGPMTISKQCFLAGKSIEPPDYCVTVGSQVVMMKDRFTKTCQEKMVWVQLQRASEFQETEFSGRFLGR